MKIFKITLLLSLFLYANDTNNSLQDFSHKVLFKINSNESINKQFKDTHSTLNAYMKKYQKRYLPEVLQLLKKPIKILEGKDFLLVELLLKKDDYKTLLVYIKYLEYNNKYNQAIHLYHNILKGQYNTKSLAYIVPISNIVIENMTINNIKSSLQKYHAHSMHNILKNKISPYLLLDTQKWFETLEHEHQETLKLIGNMTEESYKVPNLEKNPNYEKIMEIFESKSKYYTNLYYKKRVESMKINQLDNYYTFMQSEQKKFSSLEKKFSFWKESFLLQVQTFLGFENIDYSIIADYIGQTMALVATPKMEKVYLDYLENVERNKKFLEQL